MTTAINSEPCPYCGMLHYAVCPKVKVIEYFEDGRVKRVEFMTVADYLAPLRPLAPLAPTFSPNEAPPGGV